MSKLAVLICGYDGYSPVWKTNIELLNKYWNSCPFPIYFSTCEKNVNSDRVIEIKCGKKGFCERLNFALENIKEEYVLIMMEDYFLTDYPNDHVLTDIVEYMIENNVFCTRLSPFPCAKVYDVSYKNISLGKIDSKSEYSVSLQTSIWNKKKFSNFIKKYDTAWDIEFLGSREYPIGEITLCVSKDEYKSIISDFGTEGAIQGGKWTRYAIKYAKKNKIELSKDIKNESYIYYIWKKIKSTLLFPIIKIIKKTKFYNNYRKNRYNKVIKRT